MIANSAKIAKHLRKLKGDLKGGNCFIPMTLNLILARGYIVSDDKKLVIWVNAEEHLQIISQKDNGHLSSVHERIAKYTLN
jgi:hypothetical protein